MLRRLDDLIEWCGMKFKVKKSRSLSILRGQVRDVRFQIQHENIPLVKEEPVKSLGRWYSVPLSDKRRGIEVHEQLRKGIQAIDECRLAGKFKVWCLLFGLFPRILWPLQMYEIGLSRVERMEKLISSRVRSWLGFPRMLSNTVLYSSEAKLRLPLKSLVEEFKVGKARILLMLHYSPDPCINELELDVRTGAAWCVNEYVDDAESRVRMRETVGAVQSDRRGLGWHAQKWWSQMTARERRVALVDEVRRIEEEKRMAVAVGQRQQGAWTHWESVMQRKLSWSQLWRMEPQRLRFLVRAMADLLPTAANLQRWGLAACDRCRACGQRETLEHVLSGCPKSLQKYTWRHNQILRVIEKSVKLACRSANEQDAANGSSLQKIRFVRASEEQKCRRRRKEKSPIVETPSLLAPGGEWSVRADLGTSLTFPSHIAITTFRPDMVIWSDKLRKVLVIELTVPWEGNIEWAHERKLEKYDALREICEDRGWHCHLWAIEVGCRGFVAKSAFSFLRSVSTSTPQFKSTLTSVQEAAESASFWIWTKKPSNT